MTQTRLTMNNYEPGHSWTLQLSSIEVGPGHLSPPCWAVTFSVRVFVLVPPPHDLEHSPMIQSFHSQWTSSYICALQKLFQCRNLAYSEFISLIYDWFSDHNTKTLSTGAFFVLALFNFCRLSSAGSSICLFDKLNSCISSCTRSTLSGAISDHPIVPFAMDSWITIIYIKEG